MFPGVKPIVLEEYSHSVDTFNNVMFSSQFWDAIQTEYVLMFQCDTVFSKNAAAKLPLGGKDFYGPVCGNVTTNDFIINGGLSYRKVAAFRKGCAMLKDRGKPEDVAFTELMRTHPDDFTLPTLRECINFAVETVGNPCTAIGIHGTDKGYAPPGLLAATLGVRQPCTIYDVFSYDGEPILKTRLKLLSNVVDTFVIVEARVTHAGHPKELTFDPEQYAEWMPKIIYVVIDQFPPKPPGEVVIDGTESWWREKYQRDYAARYVKPGGGMVICGDVDEIPDPAMLALLTSVEHPIHLGMAFLVHQPWWKKREPWVRAFVCSTEYASQKSLTETRLALERGKQIHVMPDAGWHCSSFFDVDTQIRKVQHFAHREFSKEIDPDVIQRRFETGKDPYGRKNTMYDCEKTMEYIWLKFFVG
jgi:hypothetical protein